MRFLKERFRPASEDHVMRPPFECREPSCEPALVNDHIIVGPEDVVSMSSGHAGIARVRKTGDRLINPGEREFGGE